MNALAVATKTKTRLTPVQSAEKKTKQALKTIVSLETLSGKLTSTQKTAILTALNNQTEQLTETFAEAQTPATVAFTLPA